ncbi:response regulator transcription factor [Dyella terrae]|uniref:Response regulator transcription factor n=3 Tax=Dyella TaxID=231454 RepID=A0A4R0YSL0_9GAMM|nr:response regulator transcription factor [Dyella soli]TBR40741.1 response regulator transcription factor [Dyella terrae]TCI12325.1 response regulator transcription factor [Dyella soli]
MRIAILEDTVKQAHAMARWLGHAGHECIVRHDGTGFIRLLETQSVDLLLLDWDVPGHSGLEVARWVRAHCSRNIPMVLVTQHDDDRSIVEGLESGADDYVVKPIGEAALVARVKAHLRRCYPGCDAGGRTRVGRYIHDPASRTVTIEGPAGCQSVSLSARESELAGLFFSQVGKVLSKDSLIQKIWSCVDRKHDAALATYVSKLRNLLQLRSKNGLLISTVYNHGYRMELVLAGSPVVAQQRWLGNVPVLAGG